MRRLLWITAAAALVFPAALCAQEQQSQSQQSQSQSQSQSQAQSDSQQTQQSTAQSQNQRTQDQKPQNRKSQDQSSQTQTTSQTPQSQDSIAAAARKAREQKKELPHPTVKVFTNDDLPTGGGISTVGEEKGGDSASAAKDEGAAGGANDEKTWRDRFAKLRHKLDQDQAELDLLQREVGVAEVQYYGGDPTKAMNDQMSGQPFGAAYQKKVADIDAKKKQVETDKQAIADAEEELRKSGGDPGWAR
jgi:hypothetical protein